MSVLAESQNSRVEFRVKQLLEKADSVEALAVGNSHACAIDFNILGMNGYRIARGGNDLFEVDYILRAFYPYLPNLKTVLINISYFTFYDDNSAIPSKYAFFTKQNYQDFILKYPYILDFVSIREYPDFIEIDTDEINSFQRDNLGAAFEAIMANTSDNLKLRRDLYYSIPTFDWIKGDFLNFLESKIKLVVREDHWRLVFEKIFTLNRSEKQKKTEEGFKIDKYGQFTMSWFIHI